MLQENDLTKLIDQHMQSSEVEFDELVRHGRRSENAEIGDDERYEVRRRVVHRRVLALESLAHRTQRLAAPLAPAAAAHCVHSRTRVALHRVHEERGRRAVRRDALVRRAHLHRLFAAFTCNPTSNATR